MTHEKRVTLAFVTCMMLALVWIQFFAPPAVQPPKKPDQKKPANGKQESQAQKPANAKNGKQPPPPKQGNGNPLLKPSSKTLAVSRQAKREQRFQLDSMQARFRLTNRGAAVYAVKLKQYFHKYFDSSDKGWRADEKNWLPLFPGWSAHQKLKTQPEHLIFQLSSSLALDTANRFWVAKQSGDTITFELDYSNGLRLKKTFDLDPSGTSIRVTLEIVNKGAAEIKSDWTLFGPAGILREDVEDPASIHVWLYQYGDGKDSYKTPEENDLSSMVDELEEKKDYRLELSGPKLVGAALRNKYFAGVFWIESFPEEGTVWARPSKIGWDKKEDKKTAKKKLLDRSIAVGVTTKDHKLAPGETLTIKVRLVVGSLEAVQKRPFEELLDFGFFGSISSLLLLFLDLLFKLVGSYGLAIILLTMTIKLCLFPLTKKQQVSMHTYQEKIKKFQPEMEKLKEKFKSNRQKMNEELLKLYRKHNVQPIPLGGCLPVLVQIPIFFGLFRALQYAIQLRQAQFLWITDLAGPDKLYQFASSLPYIGHDLNILPIVMTIVWFIQQKTMPKPTDPQMAQQQKMMAFMPILFGFMLYHFAAGLCLYWFVSNLIGIFEQRYIKKHIKELSA